MAPTKNVSDLTKKVANKRATKAKPEKKDLKTPTIKLKFANIYVKPPKIKRKVNSQRKIELTNEVAQEQLTKSSECSPKVLPSPVTKAPINAEPEATKIQPTSKRKRKPTPKLAAIASSSDAIPLVKKTTKHKEKAKASRKSILKDTKILNVILAKGEHSNALNDLESKSSVIMKKPGPKSKTMPLAEQKILEIPTQETISLKKKTRKRTVAKTTTVQNSEDFDRSANKWEDVIDPPLVKESRKRKKSSVKLETASTTSTTAAPGSGRSAYEFDVDTERDFVEHGEGSDAENEEYLVLIVDEYPVDSENLANPLIVEAIRSIDTAADIALRTVLDPGPDQDLLSFDWRCEPEHFEGTKEVFDTPTGPTFENAELTPLGVFEKIWDADLIALIVRETNRYGRELSSRNVKPNSRLSRWKDVTDDDIKKFFAIIMLQSLVISHVEKEYWYTKSDELRIGNFGAIMPYNRFLIIKRCLHFVDNASLPVHPNRLDKIMPIIERLNQKFSSLYQLEQNISIDESLLLWKGRLSFSQKIATKKARVGIKSYELCESRTGYLWRMEVYSGKGHVHAAQGGSQQPVEELDEGNESESATSQIVLTLMRPLFNRGHTLVMDNFYNSPLLSRILKVKHKTDSMGTLRLNREFVPEGLRIKAKRNMKSGEVAFSSTKDLSVVVWMDKNVVAMISTFHEIKVGGIEKYGYYKYKPQVILDYNLSMGGIDHKDQMLHAFPIERVRNIIWYKKLFRRLLNVSIHNSFVMFNHNRTKVLGNRDFRLQLATELLQVSRFGALPRQLQPAAPPVPSQMHLPAKNTKPQRCKLCSAAKVRRTTVWRCSTCAVNLCIEGCYTDYHTV